MHPITLRGMFAMLTCLLAAPCSTAVAQTHPFVFSLLTRPDRQMPRTVLFGDVAYGRNMFASLGPDQLEQRLGAQVTLGSRAALILQGGWALTSSATRSRAALQAEVLGDLTSRESATILSVGVGGSRDYQADAALLGRLVAGYRWPHTLLIGNVRLAHRFPSGRLDAARPDAVDVSTTIGASHEVSRQLRIGLESVAEDLEGFFEADEAEGGAKVMIGPSIGVGPRGSRWGLTMAGGPVLRLSRSTVPGTGTSGELGRPGGFVVRTSVAYRW